MLPDGEIPRPNHYVHPLILPNLQVGVSEGLKKCVNRFNGFLASYPRSPSISDNR
jgi:hypothetical protein